MNDSPTLLSLADRVESERASQELNADIWLATRVGFSERSFNHWSRMQPKGSNPTELEYARDRAPNFTGSLDAAMTLLVAGWEWEVTNLYGHAQVNLPLNSSERGWQSVSRKDDNVILAFVECCLRARSALEAGHG